MENEKFVFIAKKQDRRNIFQQYSGNIEHVPNEMKEFYLKHNPVDVDVIMDGNAIQFYPVDKLDALREEYEIEKDSFIFATCNGDPIFYSKTEIFTRYHGSKVSKTEKIASSFSDFLSHIDNDSID